MIQELKEPQKKKVSAEIQNVISNATLKNTTKLKLVNQIIVRVSNEQKKSYSQLAKDEKKPLATIVRSSLDTIIKHNSLNHKKLNTPQQLKDNFTKFQKKLGLIK